MLDEEGELLPERPSTPFKEDIGTAGSLTSPDGGVLQSPGAASIEVRKKRPHVSPLVTHNLSPTWSPLHHTRV